MKLSLKIVLFVFAISVAKAEVTNIAIFNIQKTTLIADAATLGGSAIIKGAIKTGIKQSGKHLAKGIVKKESKAFKHKIGLE